MKRYRRPYPPDEGESNGPPGIMPWRIWRLTEDQERTVDGGVVVEEPLEIRLNGQTVAVLMRTPGLEKELAVGFCLGEGLVSDLMDIALVRHCGRAVPDEVAEGDALDISRNQVDVTLLPSAPAASRQVEVAQLIRSGCGRADAATLAEDLEQVKAEIRVRVDRLPTLLGQMTRRQEAYRVAGGIHAAAMFDAFGRTTVVCEDVGRHNAVDKAVGYCLLRGIPLQDKVLMSTGRASYDMVVKAVRMGIPIVASISSPTSLAVELADALNCTLLGYLRGKRLNVYTHQWRIVANGRDPSGRETS